MCSLNYCDQRMIGHRFDSNTPIAETVGAMYGYFFPADVDHCNQ